MALSNIFREPQREITESVLGIAALSIFLYSDYRFAMWLYEVTESAQRAGFPLPIGMILGAVVLIIFIALLFLTHWMGEGICNFVARHGIELRPRYRR